MGSKEEDLAIESPTLSLNFINEEDEEEKKYSNPVFRKK